MRPKPRSHMPSIVARMNSMGLIRPIARCSCHCATVTLRKSGVNGAGEQVPTRISGSGHTDRIFSRPSVTGVIGDDGNDLCTCCAANFLGGGQQALFAARRDIQFHAFSGQRFGAALAQSGTAAVDQRLAALDAQIHVF